MNKIQLRERLCKDLSLSPQQLNRLILRAPHTYKIYTIPKKTGGVRTIAQPARETKYIQHWLIENLLINLPVHASTTAYKEGASIKKNALAHAENSYFAKFDFKDFFTSIKQHDLLLHLNKHLGNNFSTSEIEDISRIACIQQKSGQDLCLSVGAPTSPLLSNTILFEFDANVADWCISNNIVYTRYADDLTFSTNVPSISNQIEPTIREIANKLEYPSLRFNRKKTIHLSKKHQRRITGVTITNEGRLSLGRDKKRMISSMVHKYSIKALELDEVFQLQGLIGFAKDIEPLFVSRLRGKYGASIITEILSTRKTD